MKNTAAKNAESPGTETLPGRGRFAALYFACASLSAFAAFVSVELTLMLGGFMAFACFILIDRRQRRFGEQAASFRIKKLETAQKAMRRDIERLAEQTARAPKTGAKIQDLATRAPPLAASRPLGKGRGAADEASEDESGRAHLTDTVIRELMHRAVQEKRMNVSMQPVMRLPQRQVRFFETFSRLRARPGSYIPAGRYMGLALQDNIMRDIDRLMLAASLQTILDTAGLQNPAPFFINVTAATLADPGFMRHLLGFLTKNKNLAGRLIFEIRHGDLPTMAPATLEILRGLGRIGCFLSIDHVEGFEFDLKFLQVLKVRFVKFDAKTLLLAARSEKGAAAIRRMKRRLEGNGIGFIVEKIEDERSLKELLDFDINYGQGFFLGRPGLPGAYLPPGERKSA